MKFIYCKQAGEALLNLDIREFSHIFKVRRTKIGEVLSFRNLIDNTLYTYRIANINKKEAILDLEGSKVFKIEAKKPLHVGWCIVDPKTIEKTLPFLNELGVYRISFVYCEFSQRNFKIDLKRINRILINSCEQCGRSSLMKIEILNSLKEFLSLYPSARILDFSQNRMKKGDTCKSFLVGCEGGFSKKEREQMDEKNIIGLENPMILKSETAVLYMSILNS